MNSTMTAVSRRAVKSPQAALGELEAAGLAAGSEEGNGRARYWSPTIPNPDADGAGDGRPGDAGEDRA
jgi:hypothetical protein